MVTCIVTVEIESFVIITTSYVYYMHLNGGANATNIYNNTIYNDTVGKTTVANTGIIYGMYYNGNANVFTGNANI